MFPDLDALIKTMVVLSAIAIVALLVGIPYGLWWLFTHVTVVIG